MTPKEKAIELVEQFESLLFTESVTDESWVKCIECALIAVNEILKTKSSGIEFFYYWDKVKHEIEQL